MIAFKELTQITAEILSDEINYLALKNKLEDFKRWLSEVSRFDENKEISRASLSFENGVATGPTWAAFCVVDIMRTRQFVRGICKAVEDVKKKKSGPVKILYAGTGPFATLILPLLTKYNPDELQLHLFEVNEETILHLKNLIKKLEIGDYVESITCADASKHKLEKPRDVDILISETMQRGLIKEQQVPIMFNLMSQLKDEVIMIPNSIKLDLALMNTSSRLMIEKTDQLRFKRLDTIIEFDKEFIHSHLQEQNDPKKNSRFKLCKKLNFRDQIDNDFDKITILTNIQVYGEEWIAVDASSLTTPQNLIDLHQIDEKKSEISLDYVIKEIPDFEYELN